MSKIVLLDNGKATVTPDGYILTQPFDFKNSLCAPNSIYQTISGLNLTQCSFHWWFSVDNLAANPALVVNILTDTGPFNGRIYLPYQFRFIRSYYDSVLQIDMAWGYPYEAPYGIGSNLFMYTFDNGKITLGVNGIQCQTFIIPGATKIISISYNSGNDNTNGNPINYRTTYFALYQRLINLQEFQYLVNQRSGNDPQNTTDLLSLYTDLQCEPIDFSLAQDSSDVRPAFRDRSGNNNHQYLEGMPVGTISEQVNYINSQLVPFLK